MLTKNEIAEQVIACGVALPANWGKLSTARAQAFLDIAKATAPKPAARASKATMPKNPKWRRTTGGGRGSWIARTPAADPVPMTRQVRRQNERREGKMPVGASQKVWHKTQGLGKITERKGSAAV